MHRTIVTHNKDFAWDQLLVLTLSLVRENFDSSVLECFLCVEKGPKILFDPERDMFGCGLG